MAAGTVSPEQAEIIVRSIEVLPSGQAVRTRGEVTLLDHAASFDATDLARAGRHLVHVVDPDGADRKLEAELAREERAAHLGRYLSITSDGAGGVRVKGRGSAEDGALLKDVLLPLATPIPATEPDEPAGCDGRDGGKVHDPREGGARMWDALIATVKHAMVTDLPPESHGAPARLLVAVTLDALESRLADSAITGLAGLTGTGMELSVSTIRRLACDVELVPVVLDSQGASLDVGRASRLVTAAIRVALVLRDRHLAFPDCDRPPLMCRSGTGSTAARRSWTISCSCAVTVTG